MCMTDETRPSSYHNVAKGLHWLIAVLIIAQFVGGKFMTHLGLGVDDKFFVYQMHKSFGLVVLGLSLYRLYWRLTHKVPALPAGMSALEQKIAPVTHWLFYGFMILVPLTGWLYVSAQSGIGTRLFFLIPVFHFPVPETDTARTILDNAHSALATAMIALLVLHVGAALKHHYLAKDETFIRMLSDKQWAGARAVPAITGALIAVGVLYLGVMLIWGEDDHHEAAGGPVTEGSQPATLPAGRHTWGVDHELSYVELTGTAFGGEKTVRLDDLRVIIELDPEAPEGTGRIEATLFMSTLDSGDAITDDELRGSGWFDAQSYPEVRFVSGKITGSEGSYHAEGELTIRTVTQPASLAFTLTEGEDSTIAEGEAVVNRLDFALGGEGSGVAPDVTVTVHIEAQRAL